MAGAGDNVKHRSSLALLWMDLTQVVDHGIFLGAEKGHSTKSL